METSLVYPEIPNSNFSSKYLVISNLDFNFNYNLDFTPYVRRDYQGYDYLSWSVAFKLLRDFNPNLIPKLLEIETLQGETSPIATLIHVAIQDSVSGLVTPTLQYSLRDNKDKPIPYPTSKDISDSLLRAYTKAIAVYTGIGYRLFTREDIDYPLVSSTDKSGLCRHPKFLLLTEINELKFKLSNFLLPSEINELKSKPSNPSEHEIKMAPNFGMSVYELKQILESLKTLMQNSSNSNYEVYQDWKSVADALSYAVSVLDISLEDAEILYADTEVDEKGLKKINFYNSVQNLRQIKKETKR